MKLAAILLAAFFPCVSAAGTFYLAGGLGAGQYREHTWWARDGHDVGMARVGYRESFVFAEAEHVSRTQADDRGVNLACAGLTTGGSLYGRAAFCYADASQDLLASGGHVVAKLDLGVRSRHGIFLEIEHLQNGVGLTAAWLGIEAMF